MKLMVRLGAVVGVALTLLVTSCSTQRGTNVRNVNDRVTTEEPASADRHTTDPAQESPRPNSR